VRRAIGARIVAGLVLRLRSRHDPRPPPRGRVCRGGGTFKSAPNRDRLPTTGRPDADDRDALYAAGPNCDRMRAQAPHSRADPKEPAVMRHTDQRRRHAYADRRHRWHPQACRGLVIAQPSGGVNGSACGIIVRQHHFDSRSLSFIRQPYRSKGKHYRSWTARQTCHRHWREPGDWQSHRPGVSP
jgi:hypothetical protein